MRYSYVGLRGYYRLLQQFCVRWSLYFFPLFHYRKVLCQLSCNLTSHLLIFEFLLLKACVANLDRLLVFRDYRADCGSLKRRYLRNSLVGFLGLEIGILELLFFGSCSRFLTEKIFASVLLVNAALFSFFLLDVEL